MESLRILACIAFLAFCACAEIPQESVGAPSQNIAPEQTQPLTPEAESNRQKKQALYPLAYSAYPYYAGYSGYAYPYAYSSYAYDDGKYYPGKYERPYLYRSYPGYYSSPYYGYY